MNSKMTTNSQLTTNEPKRKEKQQKTKQTTRTATESEKWTSHRGEFSGEWEGRNSGEKVQGRRSIISRHKIGRDKKWYRKHRTQRTYMYNSWT